jgi:RNA polymerase sigma factor (TIGR02999 family)
MESEAQGERLFSLVYDELRQLAQRYLASEPAGHTLEPAALVHEAYVHLAEGKQVEWKGKTHFFAVGARVMRRLLIDHARARGRGKRGGDWQRVTLDPRLSPFGHDLEREDVLALEEALVQLAALDPRQAEIVELRFFSGLTIEEIAAHLAVSKRTVETDWMHARAWLRHHLSSRGRP